MQMLCNVMVRYSVKGLKLCWVNFVFFLDLMTIICNYATGNTVQGYSVTRRYGASHYANGIESTRFRALLYAYYY